MAESEPFETARMVLFLQARKDYHFKDLRVKVGIDPALNFGLKLFMDATSIGNARFLLEGVVVELQPASQCEHNLHQVVGWHKALGVAVRCNLCGQTAVWSMTRRCYEAMPLEGIKLSRPSPPMLEDFAKASVKACPDWVPFSLLHVRSAKLGRRSERG